jgi:thermolysin
VPKAIFGNVEQSLSLSTVPRFSPENAASALVALGGADAIILQRCELVILALDSGERRLAYTAVVAGEAGVARMFVDANTGTELLRISEIQTQAAVGSGTGVLGDRKKLSVLAQGGTYVADDQHRPPVLTTYDMRSNLARTSLVVERGGALVASDIASDVDNEWTAPAQVDAHVHIGWTYDYLFKRFGRRGLDDRDRPLTVVTNAVSQQGALSLPSSLSFWAINAFWCGSCGPGGTGVMFFGNGIPSGFFYVPTGNNYTYFSGALDIAAHELTHGVTDSTSRLIYRNESGALNEAFSDMIGTSVEFFYHTVGTGPGRADYVMGEDISRAVRAGARDGDRSMENPTLFGDPDHYSRRFTGSGDDGGVHINSGIPNHAFYLAIEGGTNRTSGMTVQGVGPPNREQIEKVFYRAFVFMLPSNATFSTARAATIQAARDLYGVGSAPERAVTQAWAAVGVN